ncbi:MAG: hypothetical protein HZC48_13570 [Nitrospirae bacterium]|nr:hypothetical protein [Nitrospirota bacterium]
MKLGEALIKEGLITEDQMKLALERQVVLGGRIDTNIVELRFIDDASLSQFLGKFLRLPAVRPEMIDSIPDDVINILSKEQVAEYKVLPFKKSGQKLYVAMLNPRDHKALEDLSFTTNYYLMPHVITELRLLNAFEKYYGIEKEIRYIRIKDRFDPDEEFTIDRFAGKHTTGNDVNKTVRHIPTDKPEIQIPGIKDIKETAQLHGALLANAFFSAKLRLLKKSFRDFQFFHAGFFKIRLLFL